MELVFVVVDHTLEDYIELFMTAKQHLRPGTLHWYRNSLKQYAQAISDIDPQWPPHKRHLDTYFATFEARQLAPASRDNYYRAIRAWLNWLERQQYISCNPLKEYELPFKKKRRLLPKAPPERDMKKLFDTISARQDESWHNLRDYALFSVALDTGARIGELADIQLSDLDLYYRQIRVFSHKDNEERTLVMSEETVHDLQRWLIERQWLGVPHAVNHLFVSNYQQKGFRALTTWGIRGRLKVWQDRAGIARFKFNGIRHAYAIYSLRNRADLIDIKEQMGHASITTTAIYTEVVAEGRTERHRITSPRKNLGKGRYYSAMP
jgi:integrase/recombinase XerC